MNILLLNWRDINNPKSGGAEIVTYYHAKAWVKAGHNVWWFATRFEKSLPQEIIDGITIIRKGNILTFVFYAMFFYFFSKIPFDIVIDEIHGIPFFTPLYVRKPKIVFIHEVAQEIWDYMYPFPINYVGKFLETFYLPLYNKIPLWTDAPSTIEELKQFGFTKKNCFAIPCPITNKTVTKLPIKEKEKTFIFVSRVVRMKGIEEVIKAVAFIHKEDPRIKLWIVGKGEKKYVAKLKHMAKEYGIEKNVIFFGSLSEKEKLSLMGRAHLLLHASVKEGWGLVTVEAASQGTPSVVYNVAGLRDSVKNNVTGIVLSKNSPQDMARSVLSLLSDKSKYRKFQVGGMLWAKHYTWDDATRQSLQLIDRAVRYKYFAHEN